MTDPHSHEIACVDRGSAEREAVRQQHLESDPSMEWIYLRDASERWVARRVPRHGPVPPPSRRGGLVGGAIEFISDVFLNW